MRILAIETSCDDTGIAVLEAHKKGGFGVLSNVVASQIKIHQQYGGVFPAMAKREHQKNLIPTFEQALKESKLLNNKKVSQFFTRVKNQTTKKILEREQELYKNLVAFVEKYDKPDVDLIAVTNGPGLEPCLWVGVNFARAISYLWDIPVVPVNHIESHILVNFLGLYQKTSGREKYDTRQKQKLFPAIALIVSGGHTQIILVEKIPARRQAGANYKILGETRDDAAGECFDKCAKILGLPYPGGPIISQLAEKCNFQFSISNFQSISNSQFLKLPRPMLNTNDYDLSFSGLKTAVLYKWQALKKDKEKSKFFGSRQKITQTQIAFAAEIQQSIIDVLLKKTIKAAKDFGAKSIILGGGVSANHELKTQFFIKMHQDLPGVELLFPQVDHSTDNGLMTAVTAWFHKNKKASWKNLEADANLRISK